MRTADQTIKEFCRQIAAGTPTPGGGAVAAVTGALGAALVSMVAGLTMGKEKFVAVRAEMEELQAVGNRETEALLTCADEDGAAFDQVMAAFALGKATEEEKAARRIAVQAAYKDATRSPLITMRHAVVVMRGALALASRGNPNALSDANVAYLTAVAGFEGALWNVAINLGSISDEQFRQEILSDVDVLRAERAEIGVAFLGLIPDPVARFVGLK